MRTVVQGLREDSGLVRHSFSHRTAVQQSSTVTTGCPTGYLREYSTYVLAGVFYVRTCGSILRIFVVVCCCQEHHQHQLLLKYRGVGETSTFSTYTTQAPVKLQARVRPSCCTKYNGFRISYFPVNTYTVRFLSRPCTVRTLRPAGRTTESRPHALQRDVVLVLCLGSSGRNL